jgi:hypothetical protein
MMKFNIKHSGSPYNEYGQIVKLNWYQLLVLVCIITSFTNWLIPFFSKLKNVELCRITLHDKEVEYK